MAETDVLLISRATADHDTKAFDQLVQRHQSRVRGWLRHLAGDPAVADDLAQETFLKAWRKLATYNASGSFEGWLLRIARNEFLQLKRKSARETGHLERLESQMRTDGNKYELQEFQGEEANRFLNILGPDERDIMSLVFGLGLSHRETSDVTGLPLGTVKSHVRRSVLKIREQFGLTDPAND